MNRELDAKVSPNPKKEVDLKRKREEAKEPIGFINIKRGMEGAAELKDFVCSI